MGRNVNSTASFQLGLYLSNRFAEIDVNSPKYLAAQAEISDRLDEADLRKAEECRQSLQAENDRLYRDLANLKAQLQMANEKIRSMMQ